MRTAAPQYIKERRLADPGWVRRHKRSLGRNRQYRMCIRKAHDLKTEMAKLRALAKENSRADKIGARLDHFFGRIAQMFTRRAHA